MTTILLAITIDTEADHTVTWVKSSPLTFRSVLEGIPNLLQPLFNRYGAKPTYLLTSEVLENDSCMRALATLPGDYELGSHLHPEYVEPERMYAEYAGTKSHDFIGHYDPDLQLAKLATITQLFAQRVGYAPRSFRAGRFGASSATLDALEKLDYLVDTSVTPHILWKNRGGVADFTCAPEQPYFPSSRDLSSEGKLGILEVPVSVGLPSLAMYLSKTGLGSRIRRLRGIRWFCRPISLGPSFFSARQMIGMTRRTVDRYRGRPYVVLNMMFHSMEVIPCATPYARSVPDVTAFLARIEAVLDWCVGQGARFETLESVHSLLEADAPGAR
jgi:hypothetical protein